MNDHTHEEPNASEKRGLARPDRRQALTVLGTVALLVLVVPFVVFAVPGLVGGQDSFVILSGSMEPAMSPGDAIIVGAPTAVAVGDVITFDEGNEVPTTHRVVGIQDGQYVTKGDANEEPDAQLVAPADVVGEVLFTIPVIGHVILWVNTPAGYVTLVVAPILLFVANELFTWAQRRPDAAEASEADAAAAETGADADAGEPTAAAERTATDAGEDTVAVAVADLKLTVLAAGALFAYAGWTLLREFGATGAPNPVSVGALTAGLLGLLFAGWVTGDAWYRRRQDTETPESATADTSTETESAPGADPDEDTGTADLSWVPTAETDGGTEEVER